MKLKEKIYKNLVAQIVNAMKTKDLRRKLTQVEQENTAAIGAMTVLTELYKDETGRDLQNDINTDPEWSGLVERAEKDAETIFNNQNVEKKEVAEVKPVVEAKPTVELKPVVEAKPVIDNNDQLKLKRVSDNKKIASIAQEKIAQERTREPVKIVIDDTPANYDDDTDAD